MITLATTRKGDTAWIVSERSVTIGRIEYVRGRYEVSLGIGGDAPLTFASFQTALSCVGNYLEALQSFGRDLFGEIEAG